MKIIFWLLAVFSLIIGLFSYVVSAAADGLALFSTQFGKIMCLVGQCSLIVCIICVVIGIFQLRKGKLKRAIAFVLAGILYCAVIFGGFLIDEAVGFKRHEASVTAYYEQLYGKGWDNPPAIAGIPRHYQTVLNEFYVVIKDNHTEHLISLGAACMPSYYGDAPLDNLGFALIDFNGDGVDELLIGTTAPVKEGGTAVICIYSDPDNPFAFPSSIEGETHYLYAEETNGSYLIETSKSDTVWVMNPAEKDKLLDVSDYQGKALNAADRLVFDLIPFSQYK